VRDSSHGTPEQKNGKNTVKKAQEQVSSFQKDSLFYTILPVGMAFSGGKEM
jgi:hypothetical protein